MMRLLHRGLAVALLTAVGCSGTDDPVADGKAFVAQRDCASCHQSPTLADGILSGQTTAQPTTMAYGSNLTPSTATGLGGWADIQIVRAMRAGVDNQFMYLCRPMPHYDGTDATQPAMTDLEAYSIVAYLRSLPALERAIPPPVCGELPKPRDMAVPIIAADMATPVDGGSSD
jgi:hypothetical protein